MSFHAIFHLQIEKGYDFTLYLGYFHEINGIVPVRRKSYPLVIYSLAYYLTYDVSD